jgi:hypothetical protein
MKKPEDSNARAGFDVRSYIDTRVRMLFAVFNRRESDELIEVFKNRMEGFGEKTLRKVFDRCESELEKFPTVKQVLAYCYAERPSEGWKFNYAPTFDENGIPCLRDPDPTCSDCRDPRSYHPSARCKEYISRSDNRFLYLPQNCPEGREFLAAMREIAGDRKTVPHVDLEMSRRNLQAQAVAITKHYREPGEEG